MLRSRHLLRITSSAARVLATRAPALPTPALTHPAFPHSTVPIQTSFGRSRNFAAAAGDAVRIITDLKDYEEACKANEGKLIVAYHTAAWCGPCKRIWPHVQELANGHSDVAFLKIDVDDCQDVAAANGIEAMPTFLMLKDGKPVDKIVGAALDALLQSVAKNK